MRPKNRGNLLILLVLVTDSGFVQKSQQNFLFSPGLLDVRLFDVDDLFRSEAILQSPHFNGGGIFNAVDSGSDAYSFGAIFRSSRTPG